MIEQWNELKATITELRDSGGTGTQQEVCKFLVNMMEALEKQMSSDDCISRQAAIEALLEKGQSSRRYKLGEIWELNFDEIREVLNSLSPAQSKIIRCRNCKFHCDRTRCKKRIGAWFDDDYCNGAVMAERKEE